MSNIGFGTAVIGRPQYINVKQEQNMPFDLDVFRQHGLNVLESAYQQGIRYFDTASFLFCYLTYSNCHLGVAGSRITVTEKAFISRSSSIMSWSDFRRYRQFCSMAYGEDTHNRIGGEVGTRDGGIIQGGARPWDFANVAAGKGTMQHNAITRTRRAECAARLDT